MKTVFFIMILSFSSLVVGATKDELIDQYEYYRKHNDSLGQRVVIKKLAGEKITKKDWQKVRNVLLKNPRLGFDIVYKWDKLGDALFNISEKEIQINNLINQGDELMLQEKYAAAFRKFQSAAQEIRPSIKTKKENLLVYQKVLHSMARALYSLGKFKQSLEVYSWLDQDYPRIRQVLFEKMWAAFRAGRLDIANGMIASQMTSYFSEFLEPEVYLVQIYIYKSLCRENEIKWVRKKIEDLRAELKKTDLTEMKEQWAKSDIELYSIQRLATDKLKKREDESNAYFLEKKKEQEKLKSLLDKKFELEKNRIQIQLDKVLAYSYLAIGSSAFKKERTDLKSRNHMLKFGDEFWPVSDQEDWVDEIGEHLYIGDSQCKQK